MKEAIKLFKKVLYFIFTLNARLEKANIVLVAKNNVIELEYENKLINSAKTNKDLTDAKRALKAIKECDPVLLIDEFNNLYSLKDKLTDEMCYKFTERLESYKQLN